MFPMSPTIGGVCPFPEADRLSKKIHAVLTRAPWRHQQRSEITAASVLEKAGFCERISFSRLLEVLCRFSAAFRDRAGSTPPVAESLRDSQAAAIAGEASCKGS